MRRAAARVLAFVETRWAAPAVFVVGVCVWWIQAIAMPLARRSRLRDLRRCVRRALPAQSDRSRLRPRSDADRAARHGSAARRWREARSPSRRCRSSTRSRSPRGFSRLGASARSPRSSSRSCSSRIRATGSSSTSWHPTRSSRRPSPGGRYSSSSRCSIRARCDSASSESALHSSSWYGRATRRCSCSRSCRSSSRCPGAPASPRRSR